MEIRKLEKKDISSVVELWYEASVKAHHFIPPDYWKENKNAMATQYLPQSETYLAVEGDDILGFVSMADNFLAAIFVKTSAQGSGIGKQLMNHVKKTRATIELKVYKKNSDSVHFYKRNDFKFMSENIEEQTNELEVAMRWTQ